jgi:hypothetical protein
VAHRIGGRKLSRKQGPRSRSTRISRIGHRTMKVKTTDGEGQGDQRPGRAHDQPRQEGRPRRAAAVIAPGSQRAVVVNKLFDEIGRSTRTGPRGFTRIVRIGQRRGDAAEIVQLELV